MGNGGDIDWVDGIEWDGKCAGGGHCTDWSLWKEHFERTILLGHSQDVFVLSSSVYIASS